MCDPVTATVAAIGVVGGAAATKALAPSAPNIEQQAQATQTEPNPPAQINDPAAVQSAQRDRRRRATAFGRRSTIRTGAGGVSAPAAGSQTAPTKTLLGS